MPPTFTIGAHSAAANSTRMGIRLKWAQLYGWCQGRTVTGVPTCTSSNNSCTFSS